MAELELGRLARGTALLGPVLVSDEAADLWRRGQEGGGGDYFFVKHGRAGTTARPSRQEGPVALGSSDEDSEVGWPHASLQVPRKRGP